MLEIAILQLTESLAIDRYTNRLSLFNLLEEITIPSLPGFIPEVWIVIVFRRLPSDPDKAQAIVTMTLGSQELFKDEIEVSFQNALGNRVVLNLNAMPLVAAGDLTVLVRAADTSRSYSVPVRVESLQAEKNAPPKFKATEETLASISQTGEKQA